MDIKSTGTTLQRVILPTILIISIFFRPVGISFFYLLMLFILPFVPRVTYSLVKVYTTVYFILLIILSALIVLCQIGLTIFAAVGDVSQITRCSFEGILLRRIGFINLDNLNALVIVKTIWPDVLVFVGSMVIYIVLRKLSSRPANLEGVESAISTMSFTDNENNLWRQLGPIASLASLFLAAVLRPSIPGGIYFLIFLLCVTHWACNKQFARGFAIGLRCVMLILVFHIITVLAYQTTWLRERIPDSSLPARLVALDYLVQFECSAEGKHDESTEPNIDSFLCPIALLLAYYILALSSNVLINTKISLRNSKKAPATSHFDDEHNESDNIELERFEVGVETSPTSFFDHIWYGILSLCQFIYVNSFIFTNIIMMVWSIVYHSWLTFVLLIWALILWMIPNQRKAMLNSSPFIVFYAELLLIAQYLYGMELSDEELPSKVDTKGINLQQIGFWKPVDMPCVPLTVKTLFTLMFWFTLRQLCRENAEKKKTSTIADMVAPLQLTVGAAASDLQAKPEEQKTSKFFEKMGSMFKTLLIKLWIWLLLGVVFISGIIGTKMTGFRICYMALFLFFVLAFQFSWKGWLKIMYGFWVCLIFYVMLLLVLIYTYQFDSFDEYWKNYLNVSKELQKDIGLERYKTKDLFLHLVTPTILVIMTIIQIHYFHKQFVDSLKVQQQEQQNQNELENREGNKQDGQGPSRKAQSLSINPSAASQTGDEEEKGKLVKLQNFTYKLFKKLYKILWKFMKVFMEFLWSFLEIHMIKAVLLTAFIVCIVKVCMLHIILVLLCVIALMTTRWVQIHISRLISILVSILLIANMIYQVEYINHSEYNVECSNNSTYGSRSNNAEWFGLEKISENSLLYLIRGYVAYIVVSTMMAVGIFRQEQKRLRLQIPPEHAKFMFPEITIDDAYKNLSGLIKYLFNYGYFRFGFEVTLIALVSTIAFRQDLLAIVYAFWLCILFCLERRKSSRIWIVFQWFVAIVIPIQYILFVQLPPSLCIVYPWEELAIKDNLYLWAMLPGRELMSVSAKMIFDFVLLIFICRQSRVYILEKKIEKSNSFNPGGSNKSIIMDVDKLGSSGNFQNPVHDFRLSLRNWLDVICNAVFTGFFWITLAVVFLAGTNIVSIFSVGYLIGSFIFLWQGTDYYLHPLSKIMKWWNIFLGYNVIIITIKTCLQIGACLFFIDLMTHTCWLVHFLGVSCVGEDDPYSETDECPPLTNKTGIVWDAICFAFLILQKRILSSLYFRHIINDTRATAILASRGAVLIEDFRQKQIQHRNKHEREVLRKIKAKMEKIRATQKKLSQSEAKPSHYDEDATVPNQRSNSVTSTYPCSGSGYHTPIEDDEPEDQRNLESVGGIPYDLRSEMIPPPTNLTGSSLQNQVTSSTSAGMTVCFDDYLDTKRLSFGLTTYSDQESEAFLDVNAPLTDGENSIISNGKVHLSSIGTQTATDLAYRRQSSANMMVSWEERKLLSPNKEKFLKAGNEREFRRKRRFSSIANSDYDKRRFSNLSWLNDESISTKTPSIRPNSWGPIGHLYYIDSLTNPLPSPSLHQESMRSGDYYMFDDPDDKIDLSLMDEGGDFLEDEGKISSSEKKIYKRKGLFEVYQDMKEKEVAKKFVEALAARSSKFGTIGDKEKEMKMTTVSEHLLKTTPSYDLQKDEKPPKTPEPDPSTSTKRTSKTPTTTESEEESEEQGLLGRIFEGAMVSLVLRLNRLSRNYRYVMKILTDERKSLKETLASGQSRADLGRTMGTLQNLPVKPTEFADTDTDGNDRIEGGEDELDKKTDIDITQPDSSRALTTKPRRKSSLVPEIRILAPSLERGLDEASASVDKEPSSDGFDEDEFTTREHHIVVELLISSWYVVLSNTALICYLFVFINQIASASILSLPLPIMVFMWGTLSIPRPNKSFWITLIAYTQCVVLIKCMFQFKTFWFKNINLPNQPLSADKIIGVQPKENYAAYDLLLLLVIFFHRFILKSQGLWDAYEVESRVTSGTYTLKEDIPEDDTTSLQEAQRTAVVVKGDDAIVVTKKRLGDEAQMSDINLQVASSNDEPGKYVPEIVKISSTKYFSLIAEFFKNLLYKTRLPSDVYALMFLCDFINFLVLLFGCTAFGPQYGGDGGVQEYLAENKVPIPFLVMLLLQFVLIIIDRALYLRRAIVLKIVFHFLSVIGIHIWMFFVLPAITERNFNALVAPVVFYIIKCFYFLLSSYQITCGFPKRILGNFLTRGYTFFNMNAFRVYKIIPFLYELRTFLDWVCTDTTMSLWEWLKMEDIFSEIFFIKCGREYEKAFPVPRAQKRDMKMKIVLGGTFILLVVALIWAPLTIFAVFTAVGESNTPTEMSVNLQIGSFAPIYQIHIKDEIYPFDERDMTQFQSHYIKNKTAMTFITGYYATDIAAVVLPSHSSSIWSITPPDKDDLLKSLHQNHSLILRLSLSIYRPSPSKDKSKDVIESLTTYNVDQDTDGRKSLIEMIQGKPNASYTIIPNIFPKFLEIKNSGNTHSVTSLLPDDNKYMPLILKLSTKGSEDSGLLWWEISENCEDPTYMKILTALPFEECGSQMVVYTFSDKKFPSTFSWISASGIIGMYTGFVLFASRILRGVFFNSTRGIMFSDLPYVDRVLQLCLDIYLVREAKEYTLEEDLFAKLLFLYRSPETMIKWTRPKEESTEDDDYTESRSVARPE